MELNMYLDPKKPCCVKHCNNKADIIEDTKNFCCDCYSTKIWGLTITQIEQAIKKFQQQEFRRINDSQISKQKI
jgi:hypothetical protein